MPKSLYVNLVIFVFLLSISACGSSGGGGDSTSATGSSGTAVTETSNPETPGNSGNVGGIPDWIKGKWELRDWNSIDIAIRHLYIMTITDDAIAFDYDGLCQSSGTLEMQSNTPMWISNNYVIEIAAANCTENKGLDSYLGNIDTGNITSFDGIYLIRFSSVSANVLEYKKIVD